ncbi:glycosyltransferase family 4 protein [Halorutilales archaeon Cl-col2-1]
MLVSIVTPDLSHNCLGRAYVLAQLLERNYDIEIVGPKLRDTIWKPLRDKYDYKEVESSRRVYGFLPNIRELLNKISGDVVYASKPRLASYGISLLKRIGSNLPLIVDIDDWESGFKYSGNSQATAYLRGIPRLINTSSIYYTRVLESLTKIADGRTVSNYFLRNQFGGTVVPHARDTEKFNPEKFNKYNIRKEVGLPLDKFIVMFSGTPRPHKGVEELAKAVKMIDQDEILAVIIGASESKYTDRLRKLGGESILIEGMKPFDELPKWIATADTIAIPQRENQSTVGQLPAKLFDGMAMAKPIIATNVGDIPRILGKTGELVPPEEPEQIKNAIIHLKKDDSRRKQLGKDARKRCQDNYSYDALSPVLRDMISSIVNCK